VSHWGVVIAGAVALAALGGVVVLTEPSRLRRVAVLAGATLVLLVVAVYYGYFLLFPGD
jgi:hypothetical protein